MRTPDSWHTARATVAIALLTGLAFLIVEVMQPRWIGYGAFFASDWSQGANFPLALITPLTTTLLHFSFLALLFNLLILLFCGRAVEGGLGNVNLVILYGVGAYAAAAGFFAVDPSSRLPLVGASGAVSAVIGAYATLFARNRVRVANNRTAMWLNVAWLLAAWVGLQAIIAIVANGRIDASLLPGIAAQAAGFAAGVALARPLLLWRYRKA